MPEPRLASTLMSPEPLLTDSAWPTSPAVMVPEPVRSLAAPVTVSTSMSPEPVAHDASWNWPVARRSAESDLRSRDTPCGQVMSIPTEGPCRSRPERCLGRCTTTVCRDCSTVACAIASSPALFRAVSSTVVVSVSPAATVTWPAPVRTTIVVGPGVSKVCMTELLFWCEVR